MYLFIDLPMQFFSRCRRLG